MHWISLIWENNPPDLELGGWWSQICHNNPDFGCDAEFEKNNPAAE